MLTGTIAIPHRQSAYMDHGSIHIAAVHFIICCISRDMDT